MSDEDVVTQPSPAREQAHSHMWQGVSYPRANGTATEWCPGCDQTRETPLGRRSGGA